MQHNSMILWMFVFLIKTSFTDNKRALSLYRPTQALFRTHTHTAFCHTLTNNTHTQIHIYRSQWMMGKNNAVRRITVSLHLTGDDNGGKAPVTGNVCVHTRVYVCEVG